MNDIGQALSQFHLLRPLWLLGMLPACLLAWALLKTRDVGGPWQRVLPPHFLKHLLHGQAGADTRLPIKLLCLGWIIACLALSGPTWRQLPAAVQQKIDARVIVLDLSMSMLSPDVRPSRLVRARHKLADILRRSQEGLTGLVVFAGTAHVASPLTDDSNTILSMVESLSPDIMPVAGSDPVAAIEMAATLLGKGGGHGGDILLIGDDLPADTDQRLQRLSSDLRLSVLAVGTPEGAPIPLEEAGYLKDAGGRIVMAGLNAARMEAVSARLGGRFSLLTPDDRDLDHLLADWLALDDDTRESERRFDIWDDGGAWLAVWLLPLLALGYRRGWLGVMLLAPLVALSSTPAFAFEWDQLWKTPDQRGQEALESGRYDEAAKTFSSSDWQATAHYRQGEYKKAEALYQALPGVDADYNRGNALARQGKYDEALQAYEDVLKVDPTHEDALANRDLIRQLKDQPPSENEQDQPPTSGQPPSGNSGAESGESGDEGEDASPNAPPPKAPPPDAQGNPDGAPPAESAQSGQGDPARPEQAKQGESANEGSPDGKATPDDTGRDDPREGPSGQSPSQGPLRPQGESEDQQALEQWLRRIPDDPGGLLRNKFYYESQLRRNAGEGVERAW